MSKWSVGVLTASALCITFARVAAAAPGDCKPVALEAHEGEGLSTAVGRDGARVAPVSFVGLSATLCLYGVVVGGTIDTSLDLTGTDEAAEQHGGVLFGYDRGLRPNVRARIVGELGQHAIAELGERDDQRRVRGYGKASLRYAGVRAGVSWQSRFGATVGAWISVRHDLEQATRDVTLQREGLECLLGCQAFPVTYELGGTEVTGLVGVGWTI
jgi:hypothetical protein